MPDCTLPIGVRQFSTHPALALGQVYGGDGTDYRAAKNDAASQILLMAAHAAANDGDVLACGNRGLIGGNSQRSSGDAIDLVEARFGGSVNSHVADNQYHNEHQKHHAKYI